MFARLTFVKTRPDARDEAIKIWFDSVVPAAQQQKGNQGIDLCVSDDAPGDGVAISLWESKEDAEAGEASGYYQEQVQKFAQFFTAPPERKGYEVVSWGSR